MNRFLSLAQFLFGDETRQRVFDPLVADWQREIESSTTRLMRAGVISRGFGAFVACVLTCLLTEGIEMNKKATIGKGAALLVLSTVVLLALQMGLNSLQFALSYPLEWRIWIALPMVLPLAVPMAMLPIMMTLRSGGHVQAMRQAALLLSAGAITACLTTALAPLTRGDVRDSLYEQMNQRALANDAAGRFQYPGTAMRTLRPTTREQRDAFRKTPLYLEYQAEVTRPRFGRAALVNGALAIALGGLGWALAGINGATPIAVAAWWSISWLALILMSGQFSYWVNGAGVRVGGAPYLTPLAVFTTAVLALLIAERRRPIRAESPQAPQALKAP